MFYQDVNLWVEHVEMILFECRHFAVESWELGCMRMPLGYLEANETTRIWLPGHGHDIMPFIEWLNFAASWCPFLKFLEDSSPWGEVCFSSLIILSRIVQADSAKEVYTMVLSVTPEPPAHLPIFEKYHRVYANPYVLHKYGYLQKALRLQSWFDLYFFDRPEEDRFQATNGTFEYPGRPASTRSAGWVCIVNWDVHRNELQYTPGLLYPWVTFCAGILPNTWPCHVDVNFGFCFLMSACGLKFLQVLQQAFHISDMALKEGLKKWDFASMKSSEAWGSGAETRCSKFKLDNAETDFVHISNLKMLMVFDVVWLWVVIFWKIWGSGHRCQISPDIPMPNVSSHTDQTPQCLAQGPQQKMASTNYGHLGV